MERLAIEAQQKQHNISDSLSPVLQQESDNKLKMDKARPKKLSVKRANTSLNSSTEKEDKKSLKKKGQKEKFYCICQTPYDKSK